MDSSVPMDYMLRPGKGMNNYLTLRTRRRSKNKHNTKTTTTDVAIQKFVEILEEFKYVPYTGYRRKQSKNQPTKAYYVLLKQISNVLQSKRASPATYKKSEIRSR